MGIIFKFVPKHRVGVELDINQTFFFRCDMPSKIETVENKNWREEGELKIENSNIFFSLL